MKLAWATLLALLACTANAETLSMNSGERRVTLLELYTSQGCSSCPPAERWLNDYIDDDDLWNKVVPVAFHVDYWDYIGWKDIYATPANGERQRDYARAGKARTVYTPGFFANGREWRGWTFGMGPRADNRRAGNLEASLDGKQLTARYPDTGQALELNIVILGFGIDTRVERGENRNSTLRQEFVSLAHAAHPSGNGQWQVSLPEYTRNGAKRLGIGVWISEPGHPAPLQATGGWLE